MADARLNIKVDADAKAASAAFNDLAKDLKDVGKESVGVTDGVARVAAALDKLKSAPDTPIALARATAKAKVEIDELRAALEKTPVSADKMKSITAALAQADSAMQKAIARAGKLGEAQEEVKQKMGLTAKGAESLAGSFGSLDGIMGKMADSSSSLSQNIAKVGFSVVAAGQAFEFGYGTGEKFRKGLEGIGVQLPDLSDKVGAVVVAMESMVRGYKDAELVESAAMGRARQIIALREAQAVAEQALARAQAAAGVEWKNADAEREKVVQKLNAVELALARAAKSEAEYGATVKANAPLLRELAEASDAYNIAIEKVAPRTAAAAAEAEKYAEAQKKVADGTSSATAAIEAQAAAQAATQKWVRDGASAYDQMAQAQQKWIADTGRVEGEMRKWINTTQGAGKEFGALSGDFTALNKSVREFVEAGGSVEGLSVSMTPIILGIAQASREATAALIEQALATRALTEAQAEAVGVTKGWTDYLILLRDSYESGVSSLQTYTLQLTEFRTQLQRMFGTASGEARDALQGIIGMIEQLLATAGARQTYDTSYAGELDRAFRNAGAGR